MYFVELQIGQPGGGPGGAPGGAPGGGPYAGGGAPGGGPGGGPQPGGPAGGRAPPGPGKVAGWAPTPEAGSGAPHEAQNLLVGWLEMPQRGHAIIEASSETREKP